MFGELRLRNKSDFWIHISKQGKPYIQALIMQPKRLSPISGISRTQKSDCQSHDMAGCMTSTKNTWILHLFQKESWTFGVPIGSIKLVYLPIWMVDLYGNYGKCRQIYQFDGSYGVWLNILGLWSSGYSTIPTFGRPLWRFFGWKPRCGEGIQSTGRFIQKNQGWWMHNTLAGSVSGGDFGQVHSLKATRERTGVFKPLKKSPIWGSRIIFEAPTFRWDKYKFRREGSHLIAKDSTCELVFLGKSPEDRSNHATLSSDFQSYVAFFREYSCQLPSSKLT